jgi:hypothetical protein
MKKSKLKAIIKEMLVEEDKPVTEEALTSKLTEKFDFGDRFSYGTPRDSSEFNEIAFQADEKTIEFNGHGILTEKQVIQLYYKMYDALGEVPEIR